MSLEDFTEDNMPSESEVEAPLRTTAVETKSTKPCEGSLPHIASYAQHCRAHNTRCYYTHNCGELKEYLERQLKKVK